MDKLLMQSHDVIDSNTQKIAQLFPNCVTEYINKDGKLVQGIDFEKLQAELSDEIIGDSEERYQFTWPDKRAAVRLANTSTTMTLRPCREESVDFDNTQNLYIEGDNLDVLKVLRETYLGKVKMIYIDPPYNTGNDFVYNDDFEQSREDYEQTSGLYDDEGNQTIDPMQRNTESNGRFHTDWLNMIYPRLKVARDLLTDDGVIFISINDKEINTLKCLCTELFGESNFLATLIWDKNHSAQAGIFKVYHEYILVFCKNVDYIKTPKSLNHDLFEAGAMKKVSGRHPASEFTFPAGTRFDAPDGTEIVGEYGDTERVIVTKGRLLAKDKKLLEDVTLKAGFTQANQMKQYFYGDRDSLVDSQGQRITEFYFNSKGKIKVVKERCVESPQTTCHHGTQGSASTELSKLFGIEESPFSSPKPVDMIRDFILRFVNEGDIVLDFFSGSATTAHAVFEANASKLVKNIKFILIQIAENLDESLISAQKDAVRTLEVGIELLDSIGKKHNICEIGKERIRRAGKKVKEEAGLSAQNLDTGFRVLKLDSSNMEDVYYTPQEFELQSLFMENVKADRTGEDLLFQVMLDLGVELSVKIENENLKIENGRTITVHNVDEGYLMACFDRDIDEATITEIAKRQPVYFVMRDASAASDNVIDNFEQIFKHYSPDTVCRII